MRYARLVSMKISQLPSRTSESGTALYAPVQDGIAKSTRSVKYSEAKPPISLSDYVHCFWELKTLQTLTDDFIYHALPDACVNILFNQMDTRIAGITALRTEAEPLNLGRSFHYVGIQLFPGVWQGSPDEIVDTYVGTPYSGRLPLIQTSVQLAELEFADKSPVFASLVEWFIEQKLVVADPVTLEILKCLDVISSVNEMAEVTKLSPRQLQRRLKDSTGLSPHDLLKVLRLQQSFRKHYLELYSDQSHYIHSFRKLTGYTPAKYLDTFEVDV
jgi:AraC-like DNA-binding protein